MKKKLLMFVFLTIAGVATAVAQPRAVGVNLGYGVDVSYQHSLGNANMIDLSVNLPAFNGIGATATYDWINPFNTAVPWDYQGVWNWYMGVGAGGGIYTFNNPSWFVGAVGHVGIEYQFWFPLQLSLDWRPNIGVHGHQGGATFNISGVYYGITLGVRYLF